MYSFVKISHHVDTDTWADGPSLQMGQPADQAGQRQLSDRVDFYAGDSHGVDRELQFVDGGLPQVQALG